MPYPTIHDVAREARVGAATVSRVLNGGSAPAATHTRVREAADRLGYIPSRSARNLRHSRTMTIGAIIRNLGNPVSAEFLRGVEQTVQDAGYSLLICDVRESAELQRRYLARIFEHRVDGLMLNPGVLPEAASLQRFISQGIPIEPSAYEVNPDGPTEALTAGLEQGAAHAAFRYLVKLGHRRIALVCSAPGDDPELPPSEAARLQALRLVLAQAGVGSDPMLEVAAASFDEAGRTVQRLSVLAQPPSAYVAARGLLAPPLLRAISDAGLSIPQDVSFVCFGDSDWALAYTPPLSVVRWELFSLGRAYAERLLARIERRPLDPELARLPEPQFVPRGSCAPPPLRSRQHPA